VQGDDGGTGKQWSLGLSNNGGMRKRWNLWVTIRIVC